MVHVAITGVPAGNKSPRRDVDVWFKEAQLPQKFPVAAIQLSLFARGLKSFQDSPFLDDNTGKLSYYRIAGIHGWPQKLPWDTVSPIPDNEGWNFCVHGNTTFPTWHRPYLALYEQTIYSHMKAIISKEVPAANQKQWNDAADTWRLPYWDYALRPAICYIAALETIDILDTTKPDKTVPYQNPMYSYRLATGSTFGDKNVMGKLAIPDILDSKGQVAIPASIVKGTSRYAMKLPIDPNAKWVNGISENEAVSAAFRKPQWPDKPNKASGSIAENVYRLMTKDYFKSWRAFASTKYYNKDQQNREWLSLEAVHNMAHNWTGGSDIKKEGTGHMSSIELSAFDPIFWLHHNFIDMIMATWQTRTQNKFWFNDQVDQTDPKPTAPLLPFHKANDQYFTSNDTKDWTSLNYTYDLLVPRADQFTSNGVLDEEKYLADLAEELNRRYSTTRTEVLDTISAPNMNMIANDQMQNDYVINVTYNKHALKEPYSIHLFAGPLDPSIVADSAQPNRLGTVYSFSRFGSTDACPNCRSQVENGDLSCGQIPITGAMIKDVENPFVREADGFQPAEIENYLHHNLIWKIVTLTGREIAPQDLLDLNIAVLAGHGFHSDQKTFLSTYQDYSPLYGATAGKPGGASQGDGFY